MRKFRLEDSAAVTDLLNKYLTKFDLAPIFTEQDVQHWFLPQPNIIEAYVVEDRAAGGKLTDFVSFYTLPSTGTSATELSHDGTKLEANIAKSLKSTIL